MPLFGKKKPKNPVQKYIDQFVDQEVAKMGIPKAAQFVVKKIMKKKIKAEMPPTTNMSEAELAMVLGQMNFDDDYNNNTDMNDPYAQMEANYASSQHQMHDPYATQMTNYPQPVQDLQTIIKELKNEYPTANAHDLEFAAQGIQEFEAEIAFLPKPQQDAMRKEFKAQLKEEFGAVFQQHMDQKTVDKYIDQYIEQEVAQMDIPKTAKFVVKKAMKKKIKAEMPRKLSSEAELTLILSQMQLDPDEFQPEKEAKEEKQQHVQRKQTKNNNKAQQSADTRVHANTKQQKNNSKAQQSADTRVRTNTKQQIDSSSTVILPSGWSEVKTPEGKVYYQNDLTQKTQWDPPVVQKEPKTQKAQIETVKDETNPSQEPEVVKPVTKADTQPLQDIEDTTGDDGDERTQTVDLVVKDDAEEGDQEEEEEEEEIKPHCVFYIMRLIVLIIALLWAAYEIKKSYDDTVDSDFFDVRKQDVLEEELQSNPDAFYDECTECSIPIAVAIIGFFNEFFITMLIRGIKAFHRGVGKMIPKKKDEDDDKKPKTCRSCKDVIMDELDYIWTIRGLGSGLVGVSPDLWQFKRALGIGKWLGYNCMVYIAFTSPVIKFIGAQAAAGYFMSKKEEKEKEEEEKEHQRSILDAAPMANLKRSCKRDCINMCKDPGLLVISLTALVHYPGLVGVQFTHVFPFLVVYIWIWIVPFCIFYCVMSCVESCKKDNNNNKSNKCCDCFCGMLKIIFVPLGAALCYAVAIYVINVMIALYIGTGYIDSLFAALRVEDVYEWMECSGLTAEYTGYYNQIKFVLVYLI